VYVFKAGIYSLYGKGCSARLEMQFYELWDKTKTLFAASSSIENSGNTPIIQANIDGQIVGFLIVNLQMT
jgi:hypothetical protein